MHGILRLSPALADTIATEEYVDEGSAQEVELRAVSVDRWRSAVPVAVLCVPLRPTVENSYAICVFGAARRRQYTLLTLS
jgi:hypothetical protein